uniref:Growth arrest and DNA damage inducible beta n=1 Tax=Homo sapiens TaxID=9606 RepID=A0ABB0MVC3_HUMAN
MTLEELVACDNAAQKMQTVTAAVEELLVAAQRQDRLTVGVYESAKLMNVTLTRTPGRATAWWRWPATAKKAGATTSGSPTSLFRNAEALPSSRIC